MAEEIVRKLIGGEWVTTYENAGGGSQSVKLVRVPISFDTPDLVLTGIVVYTPAAGDVLVGNAAVLTFISEAWDGTAPSLHWGTPDDPILYSDTHSLIGTVDLTADDATAGALTQSQITDSPNGSLKFVDATPLVVMVDDFDGNDPESTQGAGEIILMVWPA